MSNVEFRNRLERQKKPRPGTRLFCWSRAVGDYSPRPELMPRVPWHRLPACGVVVRLTHRLEAYATSIQAARRLIGLIAAATHVIAGGGGNNRGVADRVETVGGLAPVVVAACARIPVAVATAAWPPAVVCPLTVVVAGIAVAVAKLFAVRQMVIRERLRVVELLSGRPVTGVLERLALQRIVRGQFVRLQALCHLLVRLTIR